MKYHISATRCPQDHRCPLVKRCPVGAITQKDFSLPIIEQEKCIQCGICYQKCPMKAVEKKEE
jgi:Fe-S-cluster-containing hydrogenase component 2